MKKIILTSGEIITSPVKDLEVVIDKLESDGIEFLIEDVKNE